jgi:hypothetical protein
MKDFPKLNQLQGLHVLNGAGLERLKARTKCESQISNQI